MSVPKVERGVVLALAEPETGPMMSRLPAFLHPVAGRPLIWHTVTSLLTAETPVREVLVLTPPDFTPEILGDLGSQVEARTFDPDVPNKGITGHGDEPILLAHASASLDRESIRRLVSSGPGGWIGGSDVTAAATMVRTEQLLDLLQKDEPFAVPNGVLSPLRRVEAEDGSFVVQSRHDLARLQGRIRDQLVRALMDAGVTFLLPESVLVDVDVRIGRDTVVYPGVMLEGSTTVGAETVIGPACRVVDSWVGSGVELRGYNYIANASIRNRAILEPYVRRGFD